MFRKSASEFMLEQYLKSGGLTTSDIEMVHLAPFDQIPAVVKGDVDAISLWMPYDLKVMALSKRPQDSRGYRRHGLQVVLRYADQQQVP